MITTRLRNALLGIAALVCLCAWLVCKGSERTYYAEPILTLTPGDAVLRDGNLMYGYYFWGDEPTAAHADAKGRSTSAFSANIANV